MFIRARHAPDDGGAGGAAAAGAAKGDASSTPSLIDGVADDKVAKAPGGHPAEKDNPPPVKTEAEKAAADAAAAAEAAKRPDWAPEQFWHPEFGKLPKEALERLQSNAKAWQDARAALTKGAAKPPAKPEDYKLPLPDGAPADLIKADDPLLAEIRTAAHAAGVSQAQLDAIAKPYLAAAAELLAKAPPKQTPEQIKEAEQAFVKGEMAKLGSTAEIQVKAIATWGKGLVERGVLSKAEYDEFRYAAGTAEGLRMLTKLRNLSGEQAIPMDAAAAGETGSLEDYYAMVASAKTPEDHAKAKRLLETLQKSGLLPAQPPLGIGVRGR